MKPKICIPIVGKNNQEIIEQVQESLHYTYDLLELRIDYYQDILDFQKVKDIIIQIKSICSKPLLFTYRSKREGGEIQLTDEQYLELISSIVSDVDIVDIELMSGNTLVYQLVDRVHQHQKQVIMSYHDFESTPDLKEIKDQLEYMEIMGGDILKVAYMPRSYKDVVCVMNATLEMSNKLTKPIVTMAMGEIGKITRLCGELTGSEMTFACLGKSSAPGQISVEHMHELLEVIHHD